MARHLMAQQRKKKKKTQDLREKIGLEVLTGVDKVDFTNKLKIHRCPSGLNEILLSNY